MISTDRLVTFFGVGHTIWFPGTAASMLAMSLAILLVSWVGFWLIWILAATFIVVGFRVSATYAKQKAVWDPSECVIDEVAAVFLIASFMPLNLGAWIAALIVFRIFDIWKPSIIGEAERLMEPGTRIMLDDLLAAVPAIAAGWAYYFISDLLIGI